MGDTDRYEKARKRRRDAPEWKKQLAIELLTPKRKRFQRRKVYSPLVDAIWTGDLLDIHKYARQNNNYKFILVLVDIFSRYAWARPLKNKSATSSADALEDVFTTSKSTPAKLWTDEGTEFYNNTVNRLLKRRNIELYSTHNDVKASIAERFIRTLRRKIESNFILTQSTVWYEILPQLLNEYNTTYHRTIKMTPKEARKPENFTRVYETLYKNTGPEPVPLYRIGDKVRISLHKRTFEKEATAVWSEEIFEVSHVLPTHPTVYKLKDLAGEELLGTFYKEQLQRTDQSIYRIDRILRRRQKADGTREVLVKWCGYPETFNSWEPADAIHRSGAANNGNQ